MKTIPARILSYVGPVHIVAGLLVFMAGFVPAVQPTLESLISASGDVAWSPFFLAVLGPNIASWGVLFTVVVSQFLSEPSPQLWRAMVWSVLVWATLDTALCLRFGVYGGAILNGAVVVVLTMLLLNVKKMAYR